MSCNISTPDKNSRIDKLEEMWTYFQSKDSIRERFTDPHYGYNPHKAAESLKYLMEQRMSLPYNADVPFKESHYRRMKVEIDDFANALKGKFSNLAFIAPEGTSKQDPMARKFYTRLNQILEYERVQTGKGMTSDSLIADYMFRAYLSTHGEKGTFAKIKGAKFGNEAIKKMRKLRQDMLKANPENQKVFDDFVLEMEKFVNSDEGVTIKQFQELIHMDARSFDKNNMLKSGIKFNYEGKEVDYNPDIVLAVREARNHLNTMGSVYIRGLEGLKKLIGLKYANTSNIEAAKKQNNDAKRWIDKIDESIDAIKIGKKEGGYFPQMQFENLADIKLRLSRAFNADRKNSDVRLNDLVDNIMARINLDDIPQHARGKRPTLDKFWEKDPMLVLSEYGKQASAFNKLVYTQVAFLETMKSLPKNNMKFIKGMKQFIEEEYAVFTKGREGRSQWANDAVTAITAFQTARTMGLNITGGIKNASSAIHFYSRVGFKAGLDTKRAYDNNEFGFADRMNKLEKEAGFLFADSASELYSEGVITKEQFETGEVRFDPQTGVLKIGDSKLRDSVSFVGKEGLSKLLFFHRWTENMQRKWMFRTSFYNKFQWLRNKGYDEAKAEEFSKAYALEMVNGWAYEYAAHAKPKIVRGDFRTVDEIESGTISSKLKGVAGAGSEVAFQLMHYPISLLESQSSSLKGMWKALKANQGMDSEELQYGLRYAGAMSVLGLISIASNMNLFNIFENETQERVTRMAESFTRAGDTEKPSFGLLGTLTGPMIGHMAYGAMAMNIIDMDLPMNQILFGNVDYGDPNNKFAEMYEAYQYSTFWGTVKNKTWPALKERRGMDVIRHHLKLYPSSWTKEYGDILYGNKPKKKKKKIPKTLLEQQLQSLEFIQKAGAAL